MQVLIIGSNESAEGISELVSSRGHAVREIYDSPAGEFEEDTLDADLILITETHGLVDALGQKNEYERQRVCLAHTSLAQVIHDDVRIDDLFNGLDDLKNRLPFIERRVGIREMKEREFAAVFHSAIDGIIVIDERGIVESLNNSAERIFGYSREEVLGRNVSMLMPMPHSERHDDYIRNYQETGVAKIIGIGREVTGRRKGGELFPMDLGVSEFRKHGRTYFTGVVRDISERRRLEHEILRISEQERRRIGQDLHDGLGQMLTGIGLISQNMARELKKEESRFAGRAQEITELVREADQMARNLAHGLIQVELEGDGLSAALRRLCRNAERFFDVECVLEVDGNVRLEDSSAASNIYRITQEAVSNAVKHGQARVITVSVTNHDHALEITIDDDGIGFPETLSEDRGMGVDIMGYRARVIGGTLTIDRRPDGGTRVRCILSPE
ncbi:MAG: histidine kinase [Bacteroidetes bacterium CG12_big_fil_rev_8_21_14_0_65_60_17]|nr:MAG: histidine kinase [Bacteroidetes bacterium CG12_big_fil_rev_8_21_14_0_65_60_17]